MGFKGKGKGKGWGRSDPLKKYKAEQKVWVGGLPEGLDGKFKDLQEHFNAAGKTKWVEVFTKSKTACVVYEKPEEATTAIATLNGSTYQGAVLQVDVWTQKEKAAA